MNSLEFSLGSFEIPMSKFLFLLFAKQVIKKDISFTDPSNGKDLDSLEDLKPLEN